MGFLSLSNLIRRWEFVDDVLACGLAREAAGVLRTWDQMISAVFEARSTESWMPLAL